MRPKAEALLVELLADKQATAVEHVFRALGILHPRFELRGVYDAFVADDDARGSAAREVIEVLAPVELREALLAVSVTAPPAERRARLDGLAVGPFASPEQLFAELLADASESVRCLAAHAVGERHVIAMRADLARLRSGAGASLVGEALDQAIARLDA